MDHVVIWKVSSWVFTMVLTHGIIMASLRGLLNAMSQLWDDRPVWLRAQRGVPDIKRPTGGLAVPHNMATGRWRRGGGGSGLSLLVSYCFTNCANNILGCFSTGNIQGHFTIITSNRTRKQCICTLIPGVCGCNFESVIFKHALGLTPWILFLLKLGSGEIHRTLLMRSHNCR